MSENKNFDGLECNPKSAFVGVAISAEISGHRRHKGDGLRFLGAKISSLSPGAPLVAEISRLHRSTLNDYYSEDLKSGMI